MIMADYSLQQLLDWMKEPQNNVMWGWDAIAALSRGKVNTLLIQEYIARFTTGTYLPPVSAGIDIVGDQWQEYIHDFVLDAPRLSFEVQTAEGTEFVKGVLTMSVMGGSQIALEKNVDFWQTRKVRWISPLQGPRLFLDLQLEKVPGVVRDDGRVYLDLSLSDNFRLTFGTTPTEQRLGGEFFQELFNTLPPEKRVYPIGVIKEGGNLLMRPQSFKLGAQSNRRSDSEGFGDGAVLVFIQMEGNAQGGTPGSDYLYLIPNDTDKDYSATVVFQSARIRRAAPAAEQVMPSVSELMEGAEFDRVVDANGAIMEATSKSGGITFQPVRTQFGPFIAPNGSTFMMYSRTTGCTFPAASPTPVVLIRNQDLTVNINWTPLAEEKLQMWLTEEDPPPPNPIEIAFRYALTLDVTYGHVEENGSLIIAPLEFKLDITHELLGDWDPTIPETQRQDWAEMLLALIEVWAKAHVASIEPRIKLHLKKFIEVELSLDEFIDESIQLSFGQVIHDVAIRAPRDVGTFGKINPATTAFAIDPLEPRIFKDTTKQFTVTPSTAVTWSVENLLRSPGSPGTISASGLYTAPAQIEGNYLRVRVTATAANGFKSSALVTLLSSRLTVNPLIQLCDPGSSVTLEGGALAGGALSWTLVSPGEHSGSLTPQGNACTYTARSGSGDPTFVLDEIKISAEGDELSVYVLVTRNSTVLTVKPDAQAVLPAGQVQLRASLNGDRPATWSLPLGGPGSIDATSGVYTADPAAAERFVLVYAEWDSEIIGVLMGQAILPLPLTEFSEELRLLSN
jgi:hypothetical protein